LHKRIFFTLNGFCIRENTELAKHLQSIDQQSRCAADLIFLVVMLRLILFLPLFLCYGIVVLPGQTRHCAAEDLFNLQLSADPALANRMEAIERHTAQFARQQGGAQERSVINIPVVVHVVWNASAENISDEQVRSQIAVLNADFRRQNADAAQTPGVFRNVAADTEINFCLAAQDPDGLPTDGIVRHQTQVVGFGANDQVKYATKDGSNAWDRDRYLNIWVCNLNGSTLGYAQYPGGAAATDGVVIDYQHFGTVGAVKPPFNLGRTTTHEVGHWLNLRHIWGDDRGACTGTDHVTDTPNQGDEHYGCPAFPAHSCGANTAGDMFMNYMDYTDDACMNLFTFGQKMRMQALFAANGARSALLNSAGCVPPSARACAAPMGLRAEVVAQTAAELRWDATPNAVSYNVQWKMSDEANFHTHTGVEGPVMPLDGLAPGQVYMFRIQAICQYGAGAFSDEQEFATLSPNEGCPDQYENNDTRMMARSLSANTMLTAQIARVGDRDWYQFPVNSTGQNLKIELGNLPADYDLQLFRNSTRILTSEHDGTDTEQIILNNAAASDSYFLLVYGFDDAASTQCYTLRIATSHNAWPVGGSNVQTGPSGRPVVSTSTKPLVNQLAVYPNPTVEMFYLDLPEGSRMTTVQLFDASGRLALQQQFKQSGAASRCTIPVSHLAPGVYTLRAQHESGVYTGRILKVED
jgi:Pregnancy-associated plasma protein-A/Secretion system C-terminal sorting domain/Fibronectin type III domain